MRAKAVVVLSDMITPYGRGADKCWSGLVAGTSAISRVTRFRTEAFQSDCAATIDGLQYHQDESLVMQMLASLFDGAASQIPGDASLILATTKGEIDLLEKAILDGAGDESDAVLQRLLARVSALAGIRGEGMIVSAACASSSAAVARAAAMIRCGRSDAVLVVACDSVTEFIFSGFSSLMALDKTAARPFDIHRSGLSLGEAAAYLLVMSEERAVREKRPIIGAVAGWGLSDDANHMTGPSRESEGLILAITKAMKSAGIGADDVGFIAAHGTGTVYNDAMEMGAFRAVFTHAAMPLYSIKGGMGHTMGAAGLVETIIALRSLRERTVPPTINLEEADKDAVGWATSRCRAVDRHQAALLTNAGFSGVNAALILASG